MKENPDRSLFLGIDTSAYTTSLAVVDQEERLIFDQRRPLPVKRGGLGLRQSEAVFAHVKNMQILWQNELPISGQGVPAAVASAVRPRPVTGSYMPVFKVGEAFGLFLAQTMGLNFLASSHQEGHVLAGLWSGGLRPGRYLVLHISGGTTEILSVEEEGPGRLKLEAMGGSGDLNAGQFIDRTGKIMGLEFPAGPQFEKLAAEGKTGAVKLPVAVQGTQVSFSGPASEAKRLWSRGCASADLARAVEVCITDSISTAVNNIPGRGCSYQGIIAVGGVIANHFIRERLTDKLSGQILYFVLPRFATDNAVGLAVQAARFFKVNRNYIR